VLAVQAAGGWSSAWAPLAAAMVAWQLYTHAREGRRKGFKAEHKAVGSLLARQGSRVVAWAVVWPRYGGSAIGRAARSTQPSRALEARGVRG
jgi:hypothetical protein